MTRNEALLPVLPDAAAYAEVPEELFALLQERILRFTMGDSTSVPADTARRLLESIAYCVDLNRRYPAADVPRDAPLHLRWQAGVRQAKRIAARANLLLHQARRTPPPVTNIAYRDMIAALPSFFRAYDADFFAREIPCSFDYPLCDPVPDTLCGAEYILDYLRRLLAENQLLRAFQPETQRALYARYYEDYEDLHVNLYLPVAEMAVLCALAGAPVRGLALSPGLLSSINNRLILASEAEAQRMIDDAADCALLEQGIGNGFLSGYTKQTARNLLVRLRATMAR